MSFGNYNKDRLYKIETRDIQQTFEISPRASVISLLSGDVKLISVIIINNITEDE